MKNNTTEVNRDKFFSVFKWLWSVLQNTAVVEKNNFKGRDPVFPRLLDAELFFRETSPGDLWDTLGKSCSRTWPSHTKCHIRTESKLYILKPDSQAQHHCVDLILCLAKGAPSECGNPPSLNTCHFSSPDYR